MSPVAAALRRRGLAPALVFTGQHPGLKAADYELDAYPSFRLDCPGQNDPTEHAEMVSNALLPILARVVPDLVLVQGDTSSALGGALAARLVQLPLGHVEAGLRSHSRRHPWPEEGFRIAIDRDSCLLFAPTELSAANLRREGLPGRIHVTGNSGIDALQLKRPSLRERVGAAAPRLLVTCHRRENWERGIETISAALARLAGEDGLAIDCIVHPNPAISRRMHELLGGVELISLREPCSHRMLLEAMALADLVLSDSGGIQEEASVLGVPLLVLRDRTERPEAIACGNVELVGTATERIVRGVRKRLRCRAAVHGSRPFGDGRASERIAQIITDWLDERSGESQSPPVTNARIFP